MTPHWGRAAAAAMCVFLAGGSARADKKKPGLFDFDTWKTPAARQREAAHDLEPVNLDVLPAGPATGPLRTVRLRVYADRDYRGMVVRWQVKFRAQIDRVNRVVQPVFNVRFEIESLKQWDQSHAGTALEPIVGELEALDPGTATEWVIGLVTPFRGVAISIHQIANARLLARHFVMRGMDDEQEARALDQHYQLLSPEERERVYGERKAHKEIVIFLHEWAHTMGVIHSEDHSLIMNPHYDPRQTGFTDREKQILSLVIDRRLAKPTELYPESADLLALLEKSKADGAIASDREIDGLLDLLRRRAHGKGTTASASASNGAGAADLPSMNIPQADADTFNKAVNAINANHAEEAWTLLAPLVKRFHTGKTDAKTWLRIAQVLHRIGALTEAEAAIARADRKQTETQKLADDIETTRRRVALPRDATTVGISPDKEPAYVSSFWTATEVVASQKTANARTHLTGLSATYPEAPGVDVLFCELELRAQKPVPAAKRCAAGVAKFDEAARAHFLLGVMAINDRRESAAEKHLRQAILLDPAEPAGWRELLRLYRNTRAKARIAELSAKYNALFSKPIPE